MSDRTYSEREISDLIARAVERQQEASRRESEVGLTLAEVERIGHETGIDPAHLRAAAAEMDAAGRTLSRQSEQTRTHIAVERWIDAPLTPQTWEDAVDELQARHGADAGFWWGQNAGGSVQQIGNAYEWRHTSGLGIQTVVTASERDGRTRLRLRQLVGLASPTVEGAAYGFLPAVLVGILGGVGANALSGGSGALVVLAAFVAFALAWAIATPTIAHLDRRWRAGKLRQLDALADDLGDVLATPVGTAPDPVLASESPRLDVGLLDEAPPEEDGSSPARRVRQ